MQRSNHFDQFSELGQHEKSHRGICGIWRRDLTFDQFPKAVVQEYVAEEGSVAIDHIPKAVVQGLRGGRVKNRYFLTQGGGRISNVQRSNQFDQFSELGQHE